MTGTRINTTEGDKLDSFLVKEHGRWELYFCRGAGKCTKTLSQRMKLSRTHGKCQDCVLGKEEETLQQLSDRIQRGDA